MSDRYDSSDDDRGGSGKKEGTEHLITLLMADSGHLKAQEVREVSSESSHPFFECPSQVRSKRYHLRSTFYKKVSIPSA